MSLISTSLHIACKQSSRDAPALVTALPPCNPFILSNGATWHAQEAFVIIHAGQGAEYMDQNDPATLDQIWSKQAQLQNAPYRADGASISLYCTVPEDCRLGVCVHELGHQLFGWWGARFDARA
jgi:hypothetical protein